MTQQAELAEERPAQSTVAPIESGVRVEPHPRTLRKVAAALEVEICGLRDDPR